MRRQSTVSLGALTPGVGTPAHRRGLRLVRREHGRGYWRRCRVPAGCHPRDAPGEARRAGRPARSATRCRPAAVGTRRQGPVRLRGRQLLRTHGDHRRSVGDVPGPARLARRGVSRHPCALPREDARDGPIARHRDAHRTGEPNPGIAVLDMMMLLYFGEARQRTVAEYSELFRATEPGVLPCGVHVQRIQHRRSATRLTEATIRTEPPVRPKCRTVSRLLLKTGGRRRYMRRTFAQPRQTGQCAAVGCNVRFAPSNAGPVTGVSRVDSAPLRCSLAACSETLPPR